MPHDSLPDLDELVQLRRHQPGLLDECEKALERSATFPNEFQRARAAGLATELDEMTARMEWLEAQPLPLRRHDEPLVGRWHLLPPTE